MYITLYDSNFKALGSNEQFVATQHSVKNWSLKRRAYEFDDFTVTCRGFRNSKDACFVGLFTDEGRLKYLSFCGIPKTENGLTTITGIDCRNIFNQSVYLDFSLASINSTKRLYQYLLGKAVHFMGNDMGCRISFTMDVSVCDETPWADQTKYIERTAAIRNVWDMIQAANAMFNLILTAEAYVDELSNNYKLKFVVHRISNSAFIKLDDYNAKITLTQKKTNVAIAMKKDDPSTLFYYFLYKDNGVDLEYDKELKRYVPKITDSISSSFVQNKMSLPLKAEMFEGETLDEAKAEAFEALAKNRFQDRVTIDCNTPLGKKLEEMDLTYFGKLIGYNPADDDSAKTLPVSAIYEDSNGNKKIEFGRLSEYWFLN